MKTRFVLATALLLTVGTAIPGTIIYGQGKSAAAREVGGTTVVSAETPVTPDVISMWQTTVSADDYLAPKAPI